MSQQGSLDKGGQHAGSCTTTASDMAAALVVSFMGTPYAGNARTSLVTDGSPAFRRTGPCPVNILNPQANSRFEPYPASVVVEPLTGSVGSAALVCAWALRASQYCDILLETFSRS